MARLRTAVSALMSTGVLSAGRSTILTGVAFLYVAYVLRSVADDDSAAPFVAMVFAVAGAWQLAKGLRTAWKRSRQARHGES